MATHTSRVTGALQPFAASHPDLLPALWAWLYGRFWES